MNYRNPKLVIAFRTIFGLFILFSGVGGLMGGAEMKGVPEPMVPIMQVLWKTGIFHMIKVTEVVSGLMLLTGFLPWLAAIFLAPICIGVIIFNSQVAPEFIVSGIIISAFDAYLGYAYWDKYKALFKRT